MDNKVFGVTFLTVLASGLMFFGIANAGSYAVDNMLFPSEEFGENTYIATTDVSNMEVASAASLFSGNFDSWQQNATLLVTYQDVVSEYPLTKATLLIEETATQAQTGQQNNFVIDLSEKETRSFLTENFPVAEFSDADVQTITGNLEQALAAGQTETRVDISDDSLALEKIVVSETSVAHNLESDGAELIVDALNGMQIMPKTQFSLLDVIAELNAWDVTNAELTEIASVIYSTVLKTNLLIDERSIGTMQPKSIPLGFEAAIRQDLGTDLAFTNPNNSTFILNIDKNGEMLAASLTAYPLVYDYSVQTGALTEVEPRLIKQYSAFVSYGKTVREEGIEGVRTEVSRTISDGNEELEIEPISRDFYPPVHRIEIYPLEIPEVASSEDGSESSGESTENPDSGLQSGDIIVEDPENPGFDLDGYPIIFDENGEIVQPVQNGGLPGTGSGQDPDEEAGDQSGNSGNSGNSDKNNGTKPVYDKSGKLINP